MSKFNRFIFTVFIFAAALVMITITANFVVAHEETSEGGILNVVAEIFERIHWVFFVLVIITCYYFRYISERKIFGNPFACGLPGRKGYKGDKLIYQFHRYFVWISFAFIAVYLVSSAITLPALFSLVQLNILQKTTKFLEFFVGITFLLYLSGCYHIKYLFERLVEKEPGPCRGCWRNTLCDKQSVLNELHGYFFWISVFGVVALHILFIFGGHAG